MPLPTAREITSLYLYGSATPPSSLLDTSLIRSESSTSQISVNVNDYMSGPGRFATGAQIELIERFFDPSLIDFSSRGIAPGTYTKQDMFELLNSDQQDDNSVIINQALYRDGIDDIEDRAFVWATTQFIISDAARFIVEENGSRRIENFRLEAEPDRVTDFDFEGGFLSNIANLATELEIDPNGIGRTVIINITGQQNTPFVTYTASNLEADRALVDSWDILSISAPIVGFVEIQRLLDDLHQSGITQYIEDGQYVTFGNSSGQPILVDNQINDRDLSENIGKVVHVASPSGGEVRTFRLELTFLGSDGVDVVRGGLNDDTIIGAGGNDQLEGGGGNDFLNSGAGTDVLDGGAGTDFLDLRGQAQQTVDLATGTTSDGDTLRGIEGVIGSEGNDTITGQADGVSYLAGGAGDDVLSAPRGSDGITVVWGGAGADTITVGARNAGVLAVQVDGLTEETFRDFRLEDVNVGAGFDWGAIDLVVLNPDATDSYRYEDVIPPSYPGDTPRYLDGDLFREQNTGRGSIEYSQDEMYFTNYDEFETRPDDLELSYDPADAYVAPNLAYDGQRVFDATFLGGSVDAVFTTLSFSQRIVTNYVAREGGARKDYDRDAGELIGEGTTPSSLIPGLGAPDHTFAVESFVSQYGEDPDITETVEVWRVLWNPGEEDQGEYLLPGEVPGLVIDETPSRAFVAGGTVSFDGSGRGSITVDGANIITATLPERQEGTEADEAFLGTAGRDFVFAGGGTDSFATDGSIFGATSGGAGSGRTFTLASGDRLSSVELVSGLDGTASIRQDTGEAAWDAIYDATTTGGERERSVFYDDGRTRIEEYGTDGVIDQAKTTFEDGTIRVETFDTDGVIDGRTDTATDGIMTTTAFTGGLRTTLTRTDPANAQAWSEIIQTFAEDGTTLTRRRDAYDDGRVYETSYLDGIRTTRTGEDVQDAFVWSEIVQTFSADGMVVTGRTVTYDDGRVLVADNGSDGVIDLAVVTHGNGRVDTTTYANGLRAERLSEDLGDAFAWSTIRQTWEGDGTTLAERVVTYDDGRIATTPYDNGVAGEVIWTDPGMI